MQSNIHGGYYSDEKTMSCPECGGVLVRDTPASIVLHCTGCGRSWKMKPAPQRSSQTDQLFHNPPAGAYRDNSYNPAVYDAKTSGAYAMRPDYADGIQSYTPKNTATDSKKPVVPKILMVLALVAAAGAIWLSFHPGYNIITPVVALGGVVLAIVGISLVKKSGVGRLFVAVISIILSLGSVFLSIGVNAALMASRYGGLAEGAHGTMTLAKQVITGEKSLDQAALDIAPSGTSGMFDVVKQISTPPEEGLPPQERPE